MSHNWSVHTDPNETITVEAFDDLFITIIYGKCWRVREEKRRDFAASVWWEAENSRVEHLAAITRRHSRARSRHLFSYSSGSAEFIPLAKLETVEDERPNDERPTKNKPRSKPRFFIALLLRARYASEFADLAIGLDHEDSRDPNASVRVSFSEITSVRWFELFVTFIDRTIQKVAGFSEFFFDHRTKTILGIVSIVRWISWGTIVD